ncbi:MAG: hypothetical protein ACJ8R9_30920 [Steroidobacteraceae bacterium]
MWGILRHCDILNPAKGPPTMCRQVILSALIAALCAGVGTTPASADQTLSKAADNAIYAQKLVDEQMAKHPELLVLGIHALKPGAKNSTMIASNLNRIGKADDDDDLVVAHEHKTILAPNLKEPTKFEVAMPLKDAAGRVIGSLSTVFKYNAGDDEVKLHAAAVAIRDDVAKETPNVDALFKPTR